MYHRVLVPLEHSDYDAFVLDHVRQLAHLCHASLLLIHVADGWAARNIHHLKLRESEEMQADREYIEHVAADLRREGLDADSMLATGDPANEIAAAAEREGCDLIAMSTHGHRFLNDVFRGSVANTVRHITTIPVLLVRGKLAGSER